MENKSLTKYEQKKIWKQILEKLKNFFGFGAKRKNKEIMQNNVQNSNIEEEQVNKNQIIERAKKAFEIYAINTNPDITVDIFNILKQRLDENDGAIKRLLTITKEELEYEDIINLLENEEKQINEYKKTEKVQKIDNKFIFSKYQVPVGIIVVETDDTKEVIQNIFKAIITRNAIIIKQNRENPYRIEKLILMIVRECLNKFELDENIVQIIEKQEIPKDQVDVYINKEENVKKQRSPKLYIFQEDEYFEDIVSKEKIKLEKQGKQVEVLKGNIYDVINEINKEKVLGSAIYTQDRKIGYKFINLINSDNVYMNTTLENAETNEGKKDIYYMSKNIICEYKN